MRINDCYKREVSIGINDRIGIIFPKFETGDPIRLTITNEDETKIDTVELPFSVVSSIKEWLLRDEAIGDVRYYMHETEEEDRDATDTEIEENLEDIVDSYIDRNNNEYDGWFEDMEKSIKWTLGL